MEKNFIFNKEIGFNWHKSWNLPVIKVNLEVKFRLKLINILTF